MASFFGGPLKLRLRDTPISPTLPCFMFFIVQVELEIWRFPAVNIRFPNGRDRLCHILFNPGGLAAALEVTSDIGPPRNLGSHCWESSDKARRSCGKTHPQAWGPHFSFSPHAGTCLSYAAAVLIPINLPCWSHPSLTWPQRCPVPMAIPSLSLLATSGCGGRGCWGRSLSQTAPQPCQCPPQPHSALTIGI